MWRNVEGGGGMLVGGRYVFVDFLRMMGLPFSQESPERR